MVYSFQDVLRTYLIYGIKDYIIDRLYRSISSGQHDVLSANVLRTCVTHRCYASNVPKLPHGIQLFFTHLIHILERRKISASHVHILERRATHGIHILERLGLYLVYNFTSLRATHVCYARVLECELHITMVLYLCLNIWVDIDYSATHCRN